MAKIICIDGKYFQRKVIKCKEIYEAIEEDDVNDKKVEILAMFTDNDLIQEVIRRNEKKEVIDEDVDIKYFE